MSRNSERWYVTLGMLATLLAMVGIGTWETVTTDPGWPIWLLVGPLSGICLVSIWGAWRW